ncbi:MAG: CoA-binding protein [Candidatus Marinimicrobia bacterium]|nr:CoA-binding protein [Candidatus Neomarinimicrobiota bacterium]
MDNNQIIKILKLKSIAIVGISNKNHKPSYQIFKYLNQNEYNTIPVNPNYRSIDNIGCYPDLESINKPVDTVNIFRRSEYVLPIIESSIKINAKAIWMQDGVINQEAFEVAKNAGLLVVMNDCIFRRHQETYIDFQ